MKFIAISLLLTLPVLGQAPGIPGLPPIQPEVPPAPAPAAVPGVPNGPLPVAVRAPGFPDPDAIAIANGQSFDYENLTGQEAANLYHRHTGKRVIVQSAAGQAELRISQPGPLTNAELAAILEKQLLLEGFSLIPSGVKEVKLVRSDQNANGADVYSHGSELPPGDEYITYVMQLQYLKPDEALRAFSQIVVSLGAGGKVTAVPNAASIVISANTALIRAMIALQKEIDKPSAEVETKFVGVVYADVEELSERLNEIFNEQQQGSAAVRQVGSTPRPSIPGLVANPSQGTRAGEDSPINIQPDTRTNRIFLMGRPWQLVTVEALIKDFDAPTDTRNFLRHKLRYLPVAEFLTVAADALERTLASGSGAGGAGGSSRSTSNRPTNNSSSRNNNNNNNSLGNNSAGGGGAAGGSQAQLAQQDVNTAPESMLVGKTLLVADNISNSIIVQGPPHHVEIVENLISELDQESEQIAITAVFGRYDVTDGGSFGVDLAHIVENIGGEFSLGGRTRNGVPSVIDPGTLGTISEVLTGSGAGNWGGLSLYGQLGSELGIFVNAVEDNSNFVAISRPTVFTKNNHEARISSGARIAVPTSTFSGNVNGGTSTQVQYQNVLLELLVRPLVNDENTVTLEISLVRDDVGENRTIGADLIVPDITSDQLTTTVTVPNRSTIILGGLITETDKKTKSGVPILSSIPGIGRLFSQESKSTEKQELVIMIHPSIITSNADLDDYQREYDAGSNVSSDSRATMGGHGVLPQRGMTAAPLYDKGNNAPQQAPAPVQQPRRAAPVVSTSPSQAARQNSRSSMKNKRRR